LSDARLELAWAAVDAWNSRDLEWMRENLRPDFEFVPAVAATVEGGSVRGFDEFGRFLEEMDESWESFRIEFDEFRPVGGQLVGLGRVVAKGRGSGVELNQPLGTLVSFNEGKVARMQSFLDPEQALAAAEAGVEASR
jgi:ketosteroid isomerase-like protein